MPEPDINKNPSRLGISFKTSSSIKDAFTRGNTVLSYPIKRDDVYQGRIRFTIRKADRLNPSVGVNKILEAAGVDNIFGLGGFNKKAKTDDDTVQNIDPGLAQAAKQKQLADNNNESKKLANELSQGFKGIQYHLDTSAPVVDLYMPAGNIVMNEGIQYENVSLNPSGIAALSALAGGDTMIQAMGKGISEGLKSIFDMRGISNNDLARLAVGRLSDKLPGGVGTAGQLAVQATANPNTRSLFRNVNIREFNFTFKFIATSASEARTVEAIIRHFRSEMYPESIKAAGIPIGYNFPNAFGIQFSYKGRKARIPKLETCFLRNIQTSYNPTSATFHPDGQPTEIDLTLNFVEIRTLDKQDILGEFG